MVVQVLLHTVGSPSSIVLHIVLMTWCGKVWFILPCMQLDNIRNLFVKFPLNYFNVNCFLPFHSITNSVESWARYTNPSPLQFVPHNKENNRIIFLRANFFGRNLNSEYLYKFKPKKYKLDYKTIIIIFHQYYYD